MTSLGWCERPKIVMQCSGTIAVAVRVRPELGKDDGDGDGVPKSVQSFTYPSSVIVGSDQSVCFDAVGGPLLSKMANGYNTTLLAYGQTGSGKTYTVFGPPGSLTKVALESGTVPPAWGLLPRLALTMLSKCADLKVSAVEVYNNVPYDLLANCKQLHLSRLQKIGTEELGVRSKLQKGVECSGGNMAVGMNAEHPGSCTCFDCFKAQEAEKALRKNPERLTRRNLKGLGGDKAKEKYGMARTVGETLMVRRDASTVTNLCFKYTTERGSE